VSVRLIQGNVLDKLTTLPSDSFAGSLCDPPYELGFMGKQWDSSGIAFNTALWKEMYRVLSPGAYLLAFGGTRTYHRLTCAIEDAGFEIRDCLMWLYAQGFPKSKACLKPSYEPIVLARKPAKKILPLNIDGCRIESEPIPINRYQGWTGFGQIERPEVLPAYQQEMSTLGRWPANTIIDENYEGEPWSRYFYCAKASRKERDAGCETLPLKARPTHGNGLGNQPDQQRAINHNTHPTVKPLSLTGHLAKLILPQSSPDTQRRLLVPFSGSGSEMIGGLQAGWNDVVGIELSAEYIEIAKQRLNEIGTTIWQDDDHSQAA
jgi:DNA modification methylase